MIYKTDKLNKEQLCYLENFEKELLNYIPNLKANYPTLEVTPVWTVMNRKDAPFSFTSNADLEIKDSLEARNVVRDYVRRNFKFDSETVMVELALQFQKAEAKKQQNEKNGQSSEEVATVFIPQTPRYTFDQIILPDTTRQAIYNSLNSIQHRNLVYDTWGFSEVDPKPKSILNFFGLPGTGKTMSAHAIADRLGKKILCVNYADIESKFMGESPKNLMKAFETAKQTDSVIFFDEADSFLGKRIQNVTQGSEQSVNSLRSQMLILLEEFEGVVIFATNLVTNYDPAFESRILAHIRFDLPDREARATIIDKMLPSKLPMERRLTHDELLEASDLIDGFSGREIKGAILSMLLDKASDENTRFTLDDLKFALQKKKTEVDNLKAEEQNLRKAKIANAIRNRLEEDSAVEAERRKRNQNFGRKKGKKR